MGKCDQYVEDCGMDCRYTITTREEFRTCANVCRADFNECKMECKEEQEEEGQGGNAGKRGNNRQGKGVAGWTGSEEEEEGEENEA